MSDTKPRARRGKAAPKEGKPVQIDPVQAQREAARCEILRQRAEARKAAPSSGGTTVGADRARVRGIGRPQAPLIETRVFCVGEARRFGEEQLVEIRRVCQGDVFFKGHPKNHWPDSSPYACWHCGYHFEGPPMGMPTAWDDRLGLVTMCGNFCSPSCAVTYIGYSQPHMRVPFAVGALQRLVSKALGVSYLQIPRAPPRYVLERYGGWMTIQEFRKQGLYTVRELRRDEVIKEWRPQEVGITVWGRLVTVKGATAEEVQETVARHGGSRRLRTAEDGLDAYMNCKRARI